MSATNQVWHIARIFNFIALLAMVGMMFPLLALLWNLKSFGPMMALVAEPATSYNKKRYWVFNVVMVIFTGIIVYYANANFIIGNSPWFTLSTVFGAVLKFIIGVGIFTLASLIVNILITKKTTGELGIAHLNLKMNIVNILKCIWIACVLIGAGYITLMILDYLFHEDYRLWMSVISYMKVDYWLIALRYALVYFIPYLLISASVNYTLRKDIPEWKDTLITVIMNSLGVWIVVLISMISLSVANVQFSNFFVSYNLVVFVPITIYISRKMYNITKNIWVGAIFNSLLVAWSQTSELGAHTIYIGQNWFSIFFNM